MQPTRRNALVLMALALVMSYAVPLWAKSYGPSGNRFGAGIVVGEPTGVTFKGYLSSGLALDLIASWSFVDEAAMFIGDVTYDMANLHHEASMQVPVYVGAGARLGFDRRGRNRDRTIFGVRVPVGVALQFTKHPVELFFEAGPGIDLAPETRFNMTGGLGVRYYF